MKKLIPYGKFLKEFNLTHKNDVYLFVGKNAWDKASNFQISRPGTLCLPPNDSPFHYDWPIKDCDILIFDTSVSSLQYIEDIVYCLFNHQANIVRYSSLEGKLTVYKKDF